MYNLSDDLRETIDLSQQNPKQFDSICSAYNRWQNQLINPLWVEEKPWMDVTYHIHKQLMENKEAQYKDIWSPIFKQILAK